MKTAASIIFFLLLFCFCKTEAQNNALDFDGINDYIVVPAASSYDLNRGTIECMIKPLNFDNGNTILGVRGAGGTRYSFHIDSNAIGMWNGSDYSPVSYSFNTGVWYHVALVCDSISTTFYVNGNLIGRVPYGFSSVTGQNLIIGAVKESGSAQELFAGGMDEVRIWNTIRTAEDILENKDITLSGSEAGLVALFSFNQGTAAGTNTSQTMSIDSTSSHNNGTLNNFALTGSSSNYIGSVLELATGGSTTSPWLLGGNAGTSSTTNFIGTTDYRRLVFKSNNMEKMTILPNGNVGIGTISPTDPLTVHSSKLGYGLRIQAPDSPSANAMNYIQFSSNADFPYINQIYSNARLDITTPQNMFIHTTNLYIEGNAVITRNGDPSTTDPHSKSSQTMPFESNLWNGSAGVYRYAGLQNIGFDSTNLLHRLAFILKATTTALADGTEALSILSTGNVGIGIINPDVKLAVNGNIKAQKLIVTQTGWADYVFYKSYKLPSLKEVEDYIKANQHLPDVPSDVEIQKNGIDVGDNQKLLLSKVEQLTLYIIDLDKRLLIQQKEIERLNKKSDKKH